jgi:hypothetical protein
MTSTPQTGRKRPVPGVEVMVARSAIAPAQSPRGPERSGGAPKALDGDGAMGPADVFAQLCRCHCNANVARPATREPKTHPRHDRACAGHPRGSAAAPREGSR